MRKTTTDYNDVKINQNDVKPENVNPEEAESEKRKSKLMFLKKAYRFSIIGFPISYLILLLTMAYALLIKKDYSQLTADLIILSLTTTLAAVYAFVTFREWKVKKFMHSILAATENTYFQAFRVSRWFETDAIHRFLHWYEKDGFCYALSALGMVILKNVSKNVRLVRSAVKDMESDESGPAHHSYIEVKIPFSGWFILDLSWVGPRLIPRKLYLKHHEFEEVWQCGYKEFWSHEFSNLIYDATRNAKTSYVFDDLLRFGPMNNSALGFTFLEDGNPQKLVFGGTGTCPFKYRKDGPIVSNRILRDFVKNPRRKNPKKRSIRLAYRLRKQLEKQISG